MEYYINGVKHTVPELTNNDKLKIEKQKEENNKNYWLGISYGEAVDREIRKRYSQHEVEAILNNYLSETDNEKYKSEFEELQNYRKICKAYVQEKRSLYNNTNVK